MIEIGEKSQIIKLIRQSRTDDELKEMLIDSPLEGNEPDWY